MRSKIKEIIKKNVKNSVSFRVSQKLEIEIRRELGLEKSLNLPRGVNLPPKKLKFRFIESKIRSQ